MTAEGSGPLDLCLVEPGVVAGIVPTGSLFRSKSRSRAPAFAEARSNREKRLGCIERQKHNDQIADGVPVPDRLRRRFLSLMTRMVAERARLAMLKTTIGVLPIIRP